mmetsp:Transcript_179202/g.568673  ORF Transcript_179202/g.568673 Transcript_179202/m.568673 type:complete len:213 (+) Transcript_179202:2042-2680(+)
MGQTVLTGVRVPRARAASRVRPGSRRELTSFIVSAGCCPTRPSVSSDSCTAGRPMKLRNAGGSASWSKKTSASRPLTQSGLSAEASRSARAAGLASSGGGGGAAAASVTWPPCQISRCCSVPRLATANTLPVAHACPTNATLPARSWRRTRAMYSWRGPPSYTKERGRQPVPRANIKSGDCTMVACSAGRQGTGSKFPQPSTKAMRSANREG